jgi:15-cis-phytoene synthase
MTPDQYCAQKAAPRGSSLHYGLLFVPVEQRRAVIALHALRREVAKAADNPSDERVARARLAWWRAEVDRVFSGAPEHPVGRALMPHVAAFGIEQGRLERLLDGLEMDLTQTRYLDFEGLRVHCERVGGELAAIAAGIFSPAAAASDGYARNCGIAIRLTEILRGVGHDARHGRVYLPDDELQRFGVSAHEILKLESSDRFVELMRFQANRARGFYRDAFAALPDDRRRAQRPGLILAAIHASLLDEIDRDGFQVLRQRVSLTPLRKHWIAWRTWVWARPPRVAG